MPCKITQPVQWLLGSTGFCFSHALCGTGMVVAGSIWICGYPNILSYLSPCGYYYCLESSAGSLILVASRQLWDFFAFSCFEALVEKALLLFIFFLKAVVSYHLQFFGLMGQCKGMLQPYLPTAQTAVLTSWRQYIPISISLYPFPSGFPDA